MLIVENSKHWKPTKRAAINALAVIASKGMRTDWNYCLALADRALMFADNSDSNDVCLIVSEGRVLLESEYLALPYRIEKAEREGVDVGMD